MKTKSVIGGSLSAQKVLAASIIVVAAAMGLSGCRGSKAVNQETVLEPPIFKNVTVHDPSIIKTDDTYYIFGSHLQSAKTTDFMDWTQITSGPEKGNKLIPNASEEMSEALKWGMTNTFWAGDVIQLADGKYYMYYCTCKGDSPRSYLGLAVADQIEGPYKNLGVILRSGMQNEPSPDGTRYNANIHPNAVDPHTFFDKEGRLWMVYGSYSGGIFILEMNPETGFPLDGQGYGKKLLGGNHSRIEGAYILYNEKTDYYYMFLSFGGLGANDGYNIRVVRSKAPDGPYYDSEDNDMIECKGKNGSFFDDKSIEPYGVKLMGSYKFMQDEVSGRASAGYRSPGHNSAYYDAEKDKYFLIFHTRFEGKGEMHEVRVHQMLFNEDGWPVALAHRYAGEEIGRYSKSDIIGTYQYVNHGKDISAEMKYSEEIILNKNGKITGAVNGKWKLIKNNEAELAIDGSIYKGYFIKAWNENAETYVMSFTALSKEGVSIWGSKYD